MRLSVVIPTKNRTESLGNALDSVARQTLPSDTFEVVVVDNGSSKEALTAIERYRNKFAHWQLLSEPTPGPAAARNCGVRASSGDVILFLDDDVIADPGLLAEHLAAHTSGETSSRLGQVVLGTVKNAWSGRESAFHWLLTRRELFHSFRFPDPNNIPFSHFYTCNVSLRRAAFVEVGGFDESFTAAAFEDAELGYRLGRAGCRIIFNPRAAIVHAPLLSFEAFADKRFRAGRALYQLVTKHPELERILLPKRWRRDSRYALGWALKPVASVGEQPVPASASFILPVLGEACWLYFEYRFWSGYRAGAMRLEPQQKAGRLVSTPNNSLAPERHDE